jgi:hypothetical protein
MSSSSLLKLNVLKNNSLFSGVSFFINAFAKSFDFDFGISSRNAAKFLETPLNVKSVQALKAEAEGVVGLDDMILNIQRAQGEAIASNLDASANYIELFGNGKILATEGAGAASTRIPAHRIASPEIIRGLAIQEGLSVDSKLIDDALKRYGFKAVQYGSNKVRLLD